jgi:hypothetical protein
MTREGELFAALAAAKAYRRAGAKLTLLDAGGQAILRLQQTDWD